MIRLLNLLLVLLMAGSVVASTREAAEHVRQGITHFNAGELEQAESAFNEADIVLPDDPRIAFDRGCVKMKLGEHDEAVPLLQVAAMARDAELALAARYNLGCNAAAHARKIFGQSPEQADADTRKEGLEKLAIAVDHFRQCVKLDPDHQEARRNLELIRLWIKQMSDLWQRQDREKARQEMNLLQFLEMLQKQQSQFRETAKLLEKEEDSPLRRQAQRKLGESQRLLTDEIEPLKQKLTQAFQSQQQQGQGVQPPAKEAQQALDLLLGVADDAASRMKASARQLEASQLDSSVTSQTGVLDHLNELYTVIAPFEHMIQRAIQVQKTLRDFTAPPDEDGEESVTPANTYDLNEQAWQQNRITQWSQVLPLKAEQTLKQLEQSQQPQQPAATQPANEDPQIAGLKSASTKAMELAPKVTPLSVDAARLLREFAPADAHPKQDEALKLLEEIAKDLPRQDQQQQQQDQQNQGDQNQEQQQQNQQGDQNQKDQQKKDGESEQQQQQQKELSRQQAEAVLRKARDREQQRNKEKKRLQQYLGGQPEVDKDW